MATQSYGVQAVARAAGIPARRLEGWVERQVIVPLGRARGTGTRVRFSAEDVLRVAIIAEIQYLFGAEFRPGSIAAALGAVGRDPSLLPILDTVLRLVIGDDAKDDPEELVLCLHRTTDGRLKIRPIRKAEEILTVGAVLLLLDPRQLWRRVSPKLKK